VKGDGEIVEEIVSKDRHKAINKVKLSYIYPQVILLYL